MRLQFAIALLLAFIACLSSFMIGLGSSTHFSTVLVFLAAVSSLYFTDVKRTIELNRFTSNFLILLIVFLSVGNLFRDRSVDLAIGIARLLQLIQIVVLFQEKHSRNRWHILLISFLQVTVATAFQLHLAYGFLLLVYVFANLCALTMIFLYEENSYYKKHSFAKKSGLLRNELGQRQNWFRLFKIAFATLIVGPLSLILFYREGGVGGEEEDEPEARSATLPNGPRDAKFHEYRERGRKKRRKKRAAATWDFRNPRTFLKLLREGFVPSPEAKNRTAAHDFAPSESLSGGGVSAWATDGDEMTDLGDRDGRDDGGRGSTVSGGRFDESPTGFDPGRYLESLSPHLSDDGNLSNRPNDPSSFRTSGRWPLLRYRPIFSGGTNRRVDKVDGRRELYLRLAKGTLWSLLLGVPIFLLIPRSGGTEMFGQRFSYQRWRSTSPQAVGSVGFTEEIRLGSLGNVLQNYQEVLTVDFTAPGVSYENAVGVSRRKFLAEPETPYHALQERAFYLRGVVADRYEFGKGLWTRSNPQDIALSNIVARNVPYEERLLSRDDVSESFFDTKNDMVRLDVFTQRLDTPVLFTVWPYLFPNREANHVRIHNDRLEFPEGRRFPRDGFLQSFYTNAFRKGIQQELVPLVEDINVFSMLECTEKDVPELVALAVAWNEASGLEENDFIGRAKYLQDRFRDDDRFSYQLGGIVRRYGTDPLEDFVKTNPRGHCEYFAGTLAIMLRAVGIPSRVCIGYKAFAEERGARGYLVRQSDAHSWVEAYIPYDRLPPSLIHGPCASHWQKGGLLRLDPTPATEETMLKGFSMSLSDWNRWFQDVWRDYVLNLDGARQSAFVYQPIRDLFDTIKGRIGQKELWWSVFERYRSMFRQIKTGTLREGDLVLIVVPMAIVLGTLYFLLRIGVLRFLNRVLAGWNVEQRRRHSPIEFYVRLERQLLRFGMTRHPAETPWEYVRRCVPQLFQHIAPQQNGAPVTGAFLTRASQRIVDAFYRIRFGNESVPEHVLAEIEKDLLVLEHVALRRKG